MPGTRPGKTIFERLQHRRNAEKLNQDFPRTALRFRGKDGYAEHGPMKTIFVMVKCELGRAYAVADEAVLSLDQVSEVYSTSGKYDLLMKVYLPDTADIGHFVTERLQTLPGVKDTFTIIAFKAFSEDTSS